MKKQLNDHLHLERAWLRIADLERCSSTVVQHFGRSINHLVPQAAAIYLRRYHVVFIVTVALPNTVCVSGYKTLNSSDCASLFPQLEIT